MSGGVSNRGFTIEKSKTGEATCSFQGKFLHSKYNPLGEAERFVQNLAADFSPLCIFILEPALSYCAPFLKKRFTGATICAIRFSHFFSETDKNWDFVFYSDKASGLELASNLFEALGEEKIISSLVFDWPPSRLVFQEQSVFAWREIKKAILKARDVIATRAFFSKRWLKNSLIFACEIKNTVTIGKISLPIVISSSGPSLKSSLPFLKKYRSSFFLISVSSSFMPLLKNGILPNLVMSSDGGFWAKKHLSFSEDDCDTIFALEAESAVPKKIFESKKILPLIYDFGIERNFLDVVNCPYNITERNGTVAGTALFFALSLTDKNVFLCGQDLAPSPAFQHTQPNALEIDNAKRDFRLRNAETRMTRSRFDSERSLEIYRNWFVTNSEKFSGRVFRLSDNFEYEFSLGKIKDINWDKFSKIVDLKAACLASENQKFLGMSEKRGNLLMKKLDEISKTQKFIDEVFPMDSILIKREISSEKKLNLQKALSEKIDDFLKECERILKTNVGAK